MGTRSITVFNDSMFSKDGIEICVLYKQYDGYPRGWGAELKRILDGKKITNGISNEETDLGDMGKAVIHIIKEYKRDDLTMMPAGARDAGQNYTYFVSHVGEEIHLEIYESVEQIYEGKLSDFDPAKFE